MTKYTVLFYYYYLPVDPTDPTEWENIYSYEAKFTFTRDNNDPLTENDYIEQYRKELLDRYPDEIEISGYEVLV